MLNSFNKRLERQRRDKVIEKSDLKNEILSLQRDKTFVQEESNIEDLIKDLEDKVECQTNEIQSDKTNNEEYKKELQNLIVENEKLIGVDKTLVPNTCGSDVVEIVVNKIQSSSIFKNDRMFLRRIAFAESKDGEWMSKNRNDFSGGIWQVNKEAFEAFKDGKFDNMKVKLDKINESFHLDWNTVEWEDLDKPLLSGLAARLLLAMIENESEIPWKLPEQALIWMQSYTSKNNATPTEFVMLNKKQERDRASIATASVGDLAFVVDSSGSIELENYELMKDFIAKVCNSLQISPEDIRVGLVTFSTDANVQIPFGRCQSKEELKTAISLTPYGGWTTNTADGLLKLRGLMNTGRNGIPRVAIVLTDGQSNDSEATKREAAKVHEDKIEVFAVGVTSYINQEELEAIASQNDAGHIHNLNNFDEFEDFVDEIKERFYRVPTEVSDLSRASQDLSGALGKKQRRFMVFDLLESGIELEVKMTEGTANVYVSYTNENPNDAAYYQKVKVDRKDNPPKSIKIQAQIEHLNYEKAHVTIEGAGKGKNVYTVNVKKLQRSPNINEKGKKGKKR